MGAGFLVGLVGVLILSHAAYSAIQYRSLLKITDEEFSGPPINYFTGSCGVDRSPGVVYVGCFDRARKVMSILPHSDENRMVSFPDNLDFMVFNHRGKAFPLDMDVKLR